MATVNDILTQAMRLNRQRNASSDRVDEALVAFNVMLKSWGDIVDTPTKESFTLTTAAYSYTIGSSGDFDTTKPISLVSAYINDSDGTSYEVDISMAPFNYDRIDDKDEAGRPNKLYYDANYSSNLGNIYFNLATESAETFYLTFYKGISTYTAITETIAQPTEWEEALVYNLAIRLAPEYGIKMNPLTIAMAQRKKMEIEVRNRIAPVAVFDNAMLRT